MAPAPENSVWALMNYTPPRGQCNHKTSLMSPKCSCLRFMLHPMKVVGLALIFHTKESYMENKSDDETIKRWAIEQKEEEQNQNSNSRKRPRRILEASTRYSVRTSISENAFPVDTPANHSSPSSQQAARPLMIEASNGLRPGTQTPDLIDLSDSYKPTALPRRDSLVPPTSEQEEQKPRIIVRLPPTCSYQALVPATMTPSRKTPSRQKFVTGALDLEGLLARY
ncbi:hypothetical protein H2201_002282 [Coniosporium apollinis]|uniref:Uncharacterized protein n=1 Tax=Coniosporium apollinis TaxID=61459 RepID=A0ABQ9P5U1_9PEZI|nr:hypothetical protein H2201_002282 [Coniosporium apollinis]